MRVLQNFTIRLVLLVILGIFCLMWSSVGLYSVFSLSKVAEGNEIDRQLVNQMTLLSQGNDQYFRVVTRLSRALETKAAGGNADFSQVELALDNMKTKLDALKAISPGPMDEKVSAQAIANWQKSSMALRESIDGLFVVLGQQTDHFRGVTKMIKLGNGGRRRDSRGCANPEEK